MKLMAGKSWKNRIREEAGFTLIELMVVIVILGILAALVLPRVIGSVTSDARTNANAANIQLLKTAADRYSADTGNNCPDIKSLVESTAEGWKGPYISVPPKKVKGFTEYGIADGEVTGGVAESGSTGDTGGTGGQ